MEEEAASHITRPHNIIIIHLPMPFNANVCLAFMYFYICYVLALIHACPVLLYLYIVCFIIIFFFFGKLYQGFSE